MSQTPEEFDSLRRLLALKRFETPPPGYFDHLSSRVRSRIEAATAEAAQRPWWQRMFALPLVDRFLTAPNAFTLAGLALVGVSLTMVLNSDRPASVDLGRRTTGMSGLHTAAGIPDPSGFSPASTWNSVAEPASTLAVQNPFEALTNRHSPPSSLFAVPEIREIRGLRIDYSLDR